MSSVTIHQPPQDLEKLGELESQSVTSDSNESRVINATQGGLFNTEEETSTDESESETDQPTNEANPKQKEILETLPGLFHHTD